MAKHRAPRLAALAGGLMTFLLLAGCGREEKTASPRPAADETRAAPAPPAGDEHAHHHHGSEPVPSPATAGQAGHAGMDHGSHASGSPAGGAAHDHAGHHAPGTAAGTRGRAGGTAGQDHAGHHGHGAAAQPPAGGSGHDDHAGHGAMQHGSPAAGSPAGTAPTAAPSHPEKRAAVTTRATRTPPGPVPSGQPAETLRADALDVPAATAVRDAQRSAEIAEEMRGGGGAHGGHAGHASTYVHVDAGRAPQAGTGAPPAHGHHGAAAVYACPMHPEVTSTAPGTCPKCGMDLVEKREEE